MDEQLKSRFGWLVRSYHLFAHDVISTNQMILVFCLALVVRYLMLRQGTIIKQRRT